MYKFRKEATLRITNSRSDLRLSSNPSSVPLAQGKGGEDGQPPAPVVLQGNAEVDTFDIPDPVATRYHDRIHDQVPGGHDQPSHGRHAQNPLPTHPIGWNKPVSNDEGGVAHHKPGQRDDVRNKSQELGVKLVGVMINSAQKLECCSLPVYVWIKRFNVRAVSRLIYDIDQCFNHPIKFDTICIIVFFTITIPTLSHDWI